MRTNARRHEDALIEELSDPELAAHYLTAALEEQDLKTFLLALRHVALAKGVTSLAKRTKINRQHIYKVLDK